MNNIHDRDSEGAYPYREDAAPFAWQKGADVSPTPPARSSHRIVMLTAGPISSKSAVPPNPEAGEAKPREGAPRGGRRAKFSHHLSITLRA